MGRVHDLDGQVLLLGVDHDADTTIHLAECIAGLRYGLAKHSNVMRGGVVLRVEYRENDHCCQRFVLVDGWLRDETLQVESTVGPGHARLARSRSIVDVVMPRLSQDLLTCLHASEAGCPDCDQARASVGA